MIARRYHGITYAVLCAVGTVMPLAQFVPWLLDHGFDPRGFAAELFANRVSSFFAWDLIVSGVTTILFVIVQGRRDAVAGRWLPVAATLLIGVSCGLPLFLAMRERTLGRAAPR